MESRIKYDLGSLASFAEELTKSAQLAKEDQIAKVLALLLNSEVSDREALKKSNLSKAVT